jgi:hypothetical protein
LANPSVGRSRVEHQSDICPTRSEPNPRVGHQILSETQPDGHDNYSDLETFLSRIVSYFIRDEMNNLLMNDCSLSKSNKKICMKQSKQAQYHVHLVHVDLDERFFRRSF